MSVYATSGETLRNPSAFALGRMQGRISCSFTMFEALYDMAYLNAIYLSLQSRIAHMSRLAEYHSSNLLAS
jgi:hypothetical protein